MRRPCSVASRKSSSRQCRRNTIILISSISTHTVEALRCNVFVLLLSSVLFAPFCLHHSPLHRSTFSTVWTSRREAHRRVWLLRTLIRMACPISLLRTAAAERYPFFSGNPTAHFKRRRRSRQDQP